MLALLAVVAVTVALAVPDLAERAREVAGGEPTGPQVPDAVPDDPQPAVTLVTTLPGDDGVETSAVTVLAVDRDSGRATVLLVPTASVADVPGYGAFPVAAAHGFGGPDLVGVTLDNLLRIRVEHVGALPADGWGRAVDVAGGIEVVLPQAVTLPAGDDELRVPAGPRHVDGDLAVRLLTARGEAATAELDALPRVQRVLTGLLGAAADPDRFEPVADALIDAVDGVDAEVLRTVLGELAAAQADGRLSTLTLPVSPLGSGAEELYRPDSDRIAALVEERFAPSRPDATVAEGRRLQVLNGNGRPGVGAAVAQVLQPAGYRIVLTGNADRFTHQVSRILVHDERPQTLAAARDVRDRLGVGEIERSGTPQSVVDLTVVVGADFGGDPDGREPVEVDPVAPANDDEGDDAGDAGAGDEDPADPDASR